LLDFQILEFAASLPQNYKVRGWKLKRIFKSALADSVPHEILNLKKTGFPIPYDKWMRNEIRDFVFDTLLGHNTAIGSYFKKAKISDMLRAYQLGGGYSKEVFSLMVLELWHENFLTRRSPVNAL
jgi:asparagine synthase (glutamine-hydrolysing)